jgi:UDP-glucuronate 4-epimerase
MKILVTGGAGFIGSHLSRRLFEEGHEVVIIDDLSTDFATLQQLRVAHLLSGIEIISASITDFERLSQIFKEGAFDMVYHLAAKPGVRQSLQYPQRFAQVNYEGTVNVFECSRIHNVQHVVFASSSSVYGQSAQVPFSELFDVNEPISIYAATKRAGELLAYTYSSLYTMNITALRFFTVYGPYGRPDMAPWIFTEKIYNNQPIEIFDNGNHRRDFTYITDIVDGCVALIDKKLLGYTCFNLGQGKSVELMHFIEVIERELGKTAQRVFLEAQPGDVNVTYADTTHAKAAFDFEPKVSIEDGMKEFVRWYVTEYKNAG